MAIFQIRRGNVSSKGTLQYGEPYLVSNNQSIVFGASGSGEITLVKLNSGSTPNSTWGNSGSLSLTGDITASNAYFAGNVFISGNLKLGDVDSDTINVVASLSSSLIPQEGYIHDLGSTSKYWNRLYVGTASIG